jgi:hypothetical protein
MSEPEGLITQLVQFTTTTERLRACVRQAMFLVEAVSDVHQADKAIAPELLAAVEASSTLVSALSRAQDFASARLEIALEHETQGGHP